MSSKQTQVLKGMALLPSNPARFTEKDKLIYELIQGVSRDFIREQSQKNKRPAFTGLGIDVRLLEPGSKVPGELIDYVLNRSQLERTSEDEAYRDMEDLYACREYGGKHYRRMFSKIWEQPRMRTEDMPLISRRLSEGMFWSSQAGKKVLGSDGVVDQSSVTGGGVILEHVVPLAVLRKVFETLYAKDRDRALWFLETNVLHSVITPYENEGIRQEMDRAEERAIIRYANGEGGLNESDLFHIRYGRYIQSPHVNLGDFATLTEHRKSMLV